MISVQIHVKGGDTHFSFSQHNMALREHFVMSGKVEDLCSSEKWMEAELGLEK